VSFIRALNNMTQADTLLLIQDKRFNKQIPGKVYEYLRTNKPMLVKADPSGETAKLAIQFEGVEIGTSAAKIKNLLLILFNAAPMSIQRDLRAYNREGKANNLQEVLLKHIS
jgi:hypothetical protein